MSPRAWRWIVVLALVATAIVGVARQIEIPGVSKLIRPRVECQDSPECRSFIRAEVAQAVKDALQDRFVRPSIRHHQSEEVVTQSGSAPGQPPSPPPSGGGSDGGDDGGQGGQQPPGPPEPPPPPPDEPGLLDPVCELVPVQLPVC